MTANLLATKVIPWVSRSKYTIIHHPLLAYSSQFTFFERQPEFFHVSVIILRAGSAKISPLI